jgi:hypothetical protein
VSPVNAALSTPLTWGTDGSAACWPADAAQVRTASEADGDGGVELHPVAAARHNPAAAATCLPSGFLFLAV